MFDNPIPDPIDEDNYQTYPIVLFIVYHIEYDSESPIASQTEVDVRKYKLENNVYVLERGCEKFASEAEAVIRISMEFPDSMILKPKIRELRKLGMYSIWNTFLKYQIYAGQEFEVLK
jgi:hypothetical protein